MDPTLDKWKENTAATYTNLLLVLKKKSKEKHYISWPSFQNKNQEPVVEGTYKTLKGGSSMRYSAPGFLCNSSLYGKVT